jgi:two-component sensor histidine kinase
LIIIANHVACALQGNEGGPIFFTPGTFTFQLALNGLRNTIFFISKWRPASIEMVGEGGSATSRQAESLGLIATELVMNALKHAFPADKLDGRITVAYAVGGTNWKLSIADDGVGRPDGIFAQPKIGLGTGIIKALAQQLGAKVETLAKRQHVPERPLR